MSSSTSSYEYLLDTNNLSTWFTPSTLNAYPDSVKAHLASRSIDLPTSFASKLLSLVVPSLSYPPTSSQDASFNLILSGIQEAQTGPLSTQSDALLYYLLLDLAAALHSPEAVHVWKAMQQDEKDQLMAKPEAFAKAHKLPKGFKNAVKGYWYVDRGQLKSALPFLLQADFQPELQRALSPLSPLSPSPLERAHLLVTLQRLSQTSLSLPPTPQTEQEQEAALYALESTVVAHALVHGLSVAWRIAEAVGNATTATNDMDLRRTCKESLLRFCFLPEPQPKAIAALLSLDLSPQDEAQLEAFAVAPSAPSAALDVLLVRRINMGDYLGAVRLYDAAPTPSAVDASGGAVNASKVKQIREARKRIIDGARAVIPEVQRALLDVSREINNVALSDKQQENGDLTMSWEKVDEVSSTHQSLVPLSASPALRKPPSATSSPRSASHATDPLAALLSAVVRASPTRSTTTTPNAAAAEEVATQSAPMTSFLQRKRESLGGAGHASFATSFSSGSPGTPRSGPATPLRSALLHGTPQRASEAPGVGTPTRSPVTAKAAVLLATSGLTSRSPFAAPPRLPAPTAPGGRASGSSARYTNMSTPWTTTTGSGSGAQQSSGSFFSVPATASASATLPGAGTSGAAVSSRFAANLARGEIGSGEMRTASVPWGVEVVVPTTGARDSSGVVSRSHALGFQSAQRDKEEEDVEMEMADESEAEEIPRRRLRTAAGRKAKTTVVRSTPRSKPSRRAVAQSADANEDGDVTLPGHFQPDDSEKDDREKTASPPPRASPTPNTNEGQQHEEGARAPRKAAVQARARITRSQSSTADLRDLALDVPPPPPLPEFSTPLVKSRSTRNNTAAAAAAAVGEEKRSKRPTRSRSLHSDLSSAASASEANEEAPATAVGERSKRARGMAALSSTPVAAGGVVRRSTRLSAEPEESVPRRRTKRTAMAANVPAALQENIDETEEDEEQQGAEEGARRTTRRRAKQMPGAL